MKKIAIILFLAFTTYSCEDVIEVDLNEGQQRLVIDASINWFKNTSGNEQSIKLSLTAPFFNEDIEPANNAIVSISDTDGNTFNFLEDGSSGIYRNSTLFQ